MTDHQLIDAALAGDSMAFGELVQKYQDRLYNTLVHVSGSAEDAQDLVQEAFVQAFVKLESFQRTSQFYTWLYRIAINAAISHHRRRRPHLSIEAARETHAVEPVDQGPEPGERLECQERAGRVRACLAALSADHRAVLVLREVEGFDYETIGAMLDIPVGTVRSRLHRARLELRDQLKGAMQEDRT